MIYRGSGDTRHAPARDGSIATMNALLTLLPDFAIIAIGAFIGRHIPDAGWRQIDWLSYNILYPALLFAAASQRRIEPDALLLLGLLACAIVTSGFLLSAGASRLSVDGPANRAGKLQNGWRFNTALGFVAVAALPTSATAILAIVVGIAIPLANLFAILAFSHGQSLSPKAVLREVALNPFLLASVAGVVTGLSGQAVPFLLSALVDRLADAAIPVVLLSLGAALRSVSLWPPERYAIALHAIKLLILPALVWSVTVLGSFNGIVAATLLIFSALPTASAAHVLAVRYGADRGSVALVVLQSSALGLITLPIWTAVAVRLAT